MNSVASWRDLPFEKVTPGHPLWEAFDHIKVISDTHFHHNRLTEVLAPGSRPENFTELILDAWKKTVAKDDLVLHLGDVIVGKIQPEAYNQNLPPLPGKVYLLPGNHDRRPAKLQAFLERGWTLIHPFDFLWHDQVLSFSHEPLDQDAMAGIDLNVHGHTHTHRLDPSRYLNCCIEQIGVAPAPLEDLLQRWHQQYRIKERDLL